jgi:predicted transcriptional regulator
MKLSKAAILTLRGMDNEKKKELADLLGVHEKTVYRYINENDDNLTKAASLKFIRNETGLSDSEILESSLVGE